MVTSVVHPWADPRHIHGTSMSATMTHPWHVHFVSMGATMAHLCCTHCVSMAHPWHIHGTSMTHPSHIHGTSILYPWAHPWHINGTSMGTSMVHPWHIHSTSMAHPLRIHGTSMGAPTLPVLLPLTQSHRAELAVGHRSPLAPHYPNGRDTRATGQPPNPHPSSGHSSPTACSPWLGEVRGWS